MPRMEKHSGTWHPLLPSGGARWFDWSVLKSGTVLVTGESAELPHP